MIDKLYNFFLNNRVLLLGFGLEGQSTLRLLKKLDCTKSVTIWEQYEHKRGDALPPEYDIIMKSPGIALFEPIEKQDPRITSQADLFLRFCDNTVAGITGTKGKSTTASLLHHILTECGVKSHLIGNIGVPPLDVAGNLGDIDKVVTELSCHQLEYVAASPKIAVLLNIYEEHLDHYIDFEHYKYVKENIYRFQKPDDILIRGEDVNPDLLGIVPERAILRGRHNIHNIAVAVTAAERFGIDKNAAVEAAYSFKGLEHRLEMFAQIDGVSWVNDSISTIPEAAIAAVQTFPETDTLIIGGMDRGIDYSALIEFLRKNPALTVIALPDSGYNIADSITGSKTYKAANLEDAVGYAKRVTKKCCVLSPAAASYGFYKNFEERGRCFKELVLKGNGQLKRGCIC